MRHSDNIDIIRKYFQGKLTDSEYDYLNDFIKNPENKRVFEAEKQRWSKTPEMDDLALQNWNRLQFRLNRNKPADDKRNIKTIFIRTASVAAILIIGLLLGGIFTKIISERNKKTETIVFETPRGEKSKVRLPDGSEVWLNANSKLVYYSFHKKERKVELLGEAYFEVAKNDKTPFVVKTLDCKITVLGTKFNIMAYPEFKRNEVTLIEGRVKVSSGQVENILGPGQMLVLKDEAVEIHNVNSSLYTGWVNNKFNFKDIPLSELIKRLENWYDVDITLENKTGKEVNFSGTFKNEETVWQVLEAIKVYMPIHYEKTNLRKIKITVK